MSWDKVCQPIGSGGLGIRRLNDQNKMFLIKLGFRFLTNPDSLWVQVLRKKYNVQENLPMSIAISICSFVWKSLVRIWSDIISNTFWTVGNGRLTNFWDDVWLPHIGLLKDFYKGGGPHEKNLRVYDLVTASGQQDWDRLRSLIPSHVLRHIASILPSNNAAG